MLPSTATSDREWLSIAQMLAAQAARTPDAHAILAPGRPPLTYENLWRQVTAIVSRLGALGIGRHDRVAYALPDGPEAATLFLAVAILLQFLHRSYAPCLAASRRQHRLPLGFLRGVLLPLARGVPADLVHGRTGDAASDPGSGT